MEEEWAVTALRDQDPAGVQKLVAAYGDRLFRSACLLCGDPSEAPDLVQETFLQAFRSAGRFEGRSGVCTWLHAILLNLTRHYHRKRHRIIYDEELARQEMPLPDEPPSQLDIATSSSALMEMLRRLSPPHREVLVLRYFENMKVHELAAHLEVSPGTVKSRLHYALAELRKLMPGEMNLFGSTGTEKKEHV